MFQILIQNCLPTCLSGDNFIRYHVIKVHKFQIISSVSPKAKLDDETHHFESRIPFRPCVQNKRKYCKKEQKHQRTICYNVLKTNSGFFAGSPSFCDQVSKRLKPEKYL